METIVTAADFFAAKLSYETDPSDLAALRTTGADPVVIDTRSLAGWVQGRAHLELARLALQQGDRPGALREAATAIATCEKSSDPICAEDAKRIK